MMLSLDSPRWSELQHAYGQADDVPGWLSQLGVLPESNDNAEPWASIWSALAHQGDVYSASFAAVPHIIAAMETDPIRADASYLQFPAWVEICRQKNGVPIPKYLEESYLVALSKLPGLVAASASKAWDEGFLLVALAAIAASKGSVATAEAALELTSDVSIEFLEWFFSR